MENHWAAAAWGIRLNDINSIFSERCSTWNEMIYVQAAALRYVIVQQQMPKSFFKIWQEKSLHSCWEHWEPLFYVF